MKKTILYIAASTIGFGLMLTNCSKKSDPTPAATTSTTGTTTTGSTTNITTSGTTSSTSSGSTTTTSGSTSSSTTTGSTTSTTSGSTSSSITLKGTGTFTIDGVNYSGSVTFAPNNIDGYNVNCLSKENISIQANITSKTMMDATYDVVFVLPSVTNKAGVAVVDFNGGTKQYWSSAAAGGIVTVSGKTVTFSNIKLALSSDETIVKTVSAKLTVE